MKTFEVTREIVASLARHETILVTAETQEEAEEKALLNEEEFEVLSEQNSNRSFDPKISIIDSEEIKS